jgi:hypothetical protein
MVSGMATRLFGHRGELGLPGWARRAPAALLRWVARRRRAAGWYDRRTLALFRRAWVRGRGTGSLLGYALFRRDLGLPLAKRQAPLLRQALAQFSGLQKRLALDLLAEADGLSAAPKAGRPLDRTQAEIRRMQAVWRAEFGQWLQVRGEGGVCVVGNGGNLLGAGLGPLIDAQGVVVRFNRFRGTDSAPADIGERVDVWVTAPGFAGPVPAGVPWVVVSGADMAFRLQDWRRFAEPLRSGAKVLTVPLEHWRQLVAQLQAPPSAGVLFLAWSRSLLGSWTPLRALGFAGVGAGGPYHHADARHQPAGRHHWPAERTVLKHWQEKGLRLDLPD